MIIPYNLELSSDYYQDIRLYTNKVIEELVPIQEALAEELMQSKHYKEKDPLLVFIDLLTFSVLNRAYYQQFPIISSIQNQIFKRLIYIRKINPIMKPFIDTIRGYLSERYLRVRATKGKRIVSKNTLNCLILWMESVGEFDQEIIRLRPIISYLGSQERKKFHKSISILERIGAQFEDYCEHKIGYLLKDYQTFQKQFVPTHLYNEDYHLITRQKNEYYLNMIGAEIMNRAFKEAWRNSENHYIILTSCMRKYTDHQCKAVNNGVDMTCKHCNTACTVSQIDKIGAEYGFKTRIITHATGFSRWFLQDFIKNSTAIIGVACVLNLFSGGLEAYHAGVPAQCVLLDQPGCQKHWHHQGFSTKLSLEKLKEIIKQRKENE